MTGTYEIKGYQIPWSHYCRKMTVSLLAAGLDHNIIDVVPFQPRPDDPDLKAKPSGQTWPALFVRDKSSGEVRWIQESTEILRFVDGLPRGPGKVHVPGSLFEGFEDDLGDVPGDKELILNHSPADVNAVERVCLALDSTLGLYTRRLAYTSLMCEDPEQELLARLFLGAAPQAPTLTERLSRFARATVAGVVLTARMGLADGVREGTREETWSLLRWAGERFRRHNGYLFPGGRISAADITLACLVEPLSVQPGFANDPVSSSVLNRASEVVAACGAPRQPPYARLVSQRRAEMASPSLGTTVRIILLMAAATPVRLLRTAATTLWPERRVDAPPRRNEAIDRKAERQPETDQRPLPFLGRPPKGLIARVAHFASAAVSLSRAAYDYAVRLPQGYLP